MKNVTIYTEENRKLRQKAERLLDQAKDEAQDLAGMPPQEVSKLVHELRVHQIELKMQNDELRRIQAELEKARDRYVHLYDFAPTAYLTVDEKGAVVEANLTAATLLERPRSALVGMMFSRFVHRDDQDVWYLHRKRLLETGDFQAFQLRLVKNDGGVFSVNLECMLVEESQRGLKAIRISATDITELKRAEEKLRQSEEKYRALFESLDAGYCVIELRIEPDQPLDYRFIEINKAFERQSTLTNANGKWMRELRPNHEESWFKIYRDVALTGQPVWLERFGRELGNRWFAVNAFRIGPAQQRRVAVLFYDITDRKQTEEALRQLNETLELQVAERTELAEKRARQLQSLAVELIEAEEKERWRISELLHEDLQQILAGAKMQLQPARAKAPPEWLLDNVDRLLEHAIEKSRSLSQDLSPAILHSSDLTFSLNWLRVKMSEKFGLFTDLVILSEQPFLSEPLKVFIFRAVQELLLNVANHSGEKSARVVLSSSENSIVAAVSDTGIGFDPAIFNISTAVAKSGLGLLSLRERASYIGGRLDIESAPGQGSRITLTVPRITQDSEEPQTEEAEEQVRIASAEPISCSDSEIKVLLIDSHEVMRQALIKLVSDKPDIQIVGEAANGQDALELARQKKPNLVLMDLSMSEMECIKAIRLIKTKLPHVRVIGLLLYEDEPLARTMVQAGAECVISKTASSSELLETIYGVNSKNQQVKIK